MVAGPVRSEKALDGGARSAQYFAHRRDQDISGAIAVLIRKKVDYKIRRVLRTREDHCWFNRKLCSNGWKLV